MTPKEKANEILDYYWLMDIISPLSKEIAKRCALICVDEILKGMNNQINDIDTLDTIYWLKVKEELNK